MRSIPRHLVLGFKQLLRPFFPSFFLVVRCEEEEYTHLRNAENAIARGKYVVLIYFEAAASSAEKIKCEKYAFVWMILRALISTENRLCRSKTMRG